MVGCNCYQCHTADGAEAKAFAKGCSFEIDEHQVDLYYFFKGSSKEILVEYIDFVNLQWENMARYLKTRWLSLECCCDKELRKFPA